MKKIYVLLFAGSLAMAGCGGGDNKDQKGAIGDIKAKLVKKQEEKNKLDADIRDLQQQLAKADPQSVEQVQKLVSVDSLRTKDFTHYIELQGKIDANDIVYVTPRGMPAQVRELYVKRGDKVQKGQLLAKLDDAVMQQQLDGLKVQQSYAENIYNRQKSLWDQGIGTEVQLITAKNNVDAINKQISTMTENWKTSFVYAPISGIANEVNVKVGEIFNGGAATAPQIEIVNNSSLKMVTEVPENYVARVKKGDSVEVSVPETGKLPFKSTISVIGASINPSSRSFITEVKLPADPSLKPNQLATLKILDYRSKNVVTVPVNIVQTDEKGKYVYVMQKEADKWIARKKAVDVGESYNGMIEIKNGLAGGEQIITEGYQALYDGQHVTVGK